MQSVKDQAAKPPKFAVQKDNIPQALRDIPHWAFWTWQQNKDGTRWTKPPTNAKGKRIPNDNKTLWGPFEEAYQTYAESSVVDGLGFSMGKGVGFVVIDVDNCRDPETGVVEKWADDVVELFNSYTELSPSGEGLKIWVRGKLPEGSWGEKSNCKRFEVFAKTRYLTVTGHVYKGHAAGRRADAELHGFMVEHMQDRQTATKEATAKVTTDFDGVADMAGAMKAANEVPAEWSSDASGYVVKICQRCVRYGLDADEAIEVVREMEAAKGPFPVKWSNADIAKRYADAAKKTPLGQALERTKAAKADPRDVAEQIIDANRHVDGSGRIRWHGGKMLLWSDGRYVAQGKQADSAFVTNAMAERYTFIGQNHASNVVNHIRALTILPAETKQPSWLDSNPWQVEDCFATRDSIIHLPSFVDGGGKYRIDATPAYFSTVATEYRWQDDSPGCPIWLEFLSQLWPDDEQSIETLQMWFGYCLTADVSQHKALFLIGPKRSGKGTICSVAEHLIGAGNTSAPTVAGLAKDFGLESSLGKSLAIVADARLSKRADQAAIVETILSVTANDKIDINQKGIKAESTRMPIKLVMCSNEMPRLADASGVIASRLLILRMTKSFYEVEDTQLFAKLQGELTGILHWAIAGWAKLRERRKFTQPDSGRAMQKQIAELASPVASFVGLHCELDATAKVETETLYANWRAYCDRTGHQAGSDATFGRDLMAAYPTIERKQLRADGRRPYFYCGMALQHAAVPEFEEIPVLERCL